MNDVLNTKVKTVTVYPDQARVTIVGDINLEKGNQRIVFDELPLVLQPDSVRVGGKGEAKVRIISVDVKRAHYEHAPVEEVRTLETKIEKLEDERRILVDEVAVLTSQRKYLDGLREATKQYARGLALGRTKVADQAALGEFLLEQDSELRAKERELDKEKRQIVRAIDKMQRELNELKSVRPKQRMQAIVELDVNGEGAFKPELSYVASRAGWQPLYDIRLVKFDSGYTLEFITIAQVSQNTGQDWTAVELIVSTARPALSLRAPALKPWFVREYKPPVPMSRAQPAMEMAAATVASRISEEADAEILLADEAAPAVAEVREAKAVVSYIVPGKNDIPSDGSPHKVTISQFQLKPELDYLTVPKHTDAVYRRVKATNTGSGPLLAGTASLFVEDEFIGSSRMLYISRGEELEFLLGVEERLTVERDLLRRDVDKVRLRDKRQLQYGYEVKLKNLLPTDVTVFVIISCDI